MPVPSIPSTDARAWRATTIDAPSRWYFPLPEDALAVLEAGLAELRRVPRPLAELRLPEERRELLREWLLPVLSAMEVGRGFAVITGLDLARHSDAEAQAIYWMVGQALGEPFAQNVQGTVLYDVRDTGRAISEGVRVSVTNLESGFHTDNSFGDRVLDYVGLLCLRPAKSGGVNQVVSAFSAYEELQREHPEVLRMLEQPLHVDRRGGVKEGESATAQVPVLAWSGSELLVRYLRYWIEIGQEKAGEPLTPEQRQALDTLDAVLNRPDLRAEFTLEPGQMFFMNNRWLLHNRTAFEDYEEPERRRHYVRLWLAARR